MEPTPLLSGKFTLYQTPKGGVHLSMLVDGELEPRHIEIPAMMMRLARKSRQFEPNDGFGMAREVFTNGLVDSETVSIPDYVDDPASDLGEDYGE